MPAQRRTKRAPESSSSLPNDQAAKRKLQNRINQRHSRAKKKKAAEEAKAREAAGLTEPVRDLNEREVSTQSEAPYSPSEDASSSPPKLDTVQRVMGKDPEIDKGMVWELTGEAAMQYPGYAQSQPLQELLYPQYPVLCPNCTVLPHYSPESGYLEATGVNHVDTCETPKQPFADRLKSLSQQLAKLQ